MLGNGVVGILSESTNKWERRVPLTPSHCARLLHGGSKKTGVTRIIVQPSTKRIHHDALYEDVGCDISEDLSECGLILGIKQPKLDMILPDTAYAFFSHTHKAQKENMPLLDKILAERAALFDYELIVGDHGRRLLAFGKFAGRAGMVDFLHGLGQRYLNLGYSTPFLSLGASYMYSSLAAAKAAVISVGEEIATAGLPSGICPLVFVFTGSGNVSQGAQEIFKLLPHVYVDPGRLPGLFETAKDTTELGRATKRVFQVYGCVVTSQDMVEHKDPSKFFDKVDYYAHPENYRPIFHEKIAPFASVIVNCMYWEKRYPRLLTIKQLQNLMRNRCPLMGIADITCDIGGSIELVNQTTLIDSPFFRYDPFDDSYHHDMEGSGLICSAVDILPTEFAREASQHFGDILSQFIRSLASSKHIEELPSHLQRACIVHGGMLTSLYEYIPRMRKSDLEDVSKPSEAAHPVKMKYTTLISLSGHLFDQFLINEALDIIEAASGSFHLVTCQVGQNTNAMSYSELKVGADDKLVLDKIVDSLTSLANPNESKEFKGRKKNTISLKVGRFKDTVEMEADTEKKASVLILGAGRVCRPAAEFLTSIGSDSPQEWLKSFRIGDLEEQTCVQVIVASLFLKDAEEIVEGIPNATAVQLDVMNQESLYNYISQVDVVISLLPPSCHSTVGGACIQLKKHLVTASYVDDSTTKLDELAKRSGVTILCEMGLDPGIDHMMAMKMINHAHVRGGRIKSFISYCGGIPSPESANNPLAYKFSWSPAGAIRAGRNPSTYRYHGEVVHVDGENLYDSAKRLRLADFPAFALECLPNRDSLIYGDLYGIENEASTIFRGTLRYEGFGNIMGSLARIGFFSTEVIPILENQKRPTYRTFLFSLLKTRNGNLNETAIWEKDIMETIVSLGLCKETETAIQTAKTIVFLGFHEESEIPNSCRSAFDVTCLRMEERLAYSGTEKDMVLMHHEVEVDFPNGQRTENHRATLLECGRTKNGKTTTAMALTVGIPAAIGALLMLQNKIDTKGVLRPIDPEIYVPVLDILEAYGLKLVEKMD
ncbi:alpha-aminoadipic semialdehyde synthase [Olea europaea var. sylvestris]|uniref:alpha-aminoadipic semialdehyde synthase n=1 Tax=Olea europaea var. sylvestris TaxID=158386 RepID=UPI000C1D6CE6|nr:alpha-aminoadipic semialdehyde synthase [Olea europaea var. sylvestris]XP_022888118.1 alpha-aminoadipic semialdehyde synthase [Olea europaea var. sylvestris]XP_022888119.1 alpha-aminoadipic semialdehyde synthase [Olea europaea var. sylvestris]